MIKILIVKDKEFKENNLKEFIEDNFKFEIMISNIKDALELSQIELPNLIFLNLSDLNMNNFNLIDSLKRSIVTEDIPIIIFSNLTKTFIKNKIPLHHIEHISSSKFDKEQLKEAINSTISHENQFIGSYTNRFIKSFVSFYSSQNTALKMIAILEALSYKINIQIQKKLDMKSVLAILSTTIKHQTLNKTIKLYKDMRFATVILNLLEGFKNPKSMHEEIIYLIYEFVNAERRGIDTSKLRLKSVDEELLRLIKKIISENRVIVKSNLDFELVWAKLINISMNDEMIDIYESGKFIDFAKDILRKIMMSKSEAEVKITNDSDRLNFIVVVNQCTKNSLNEISSFCPLDRNIRINIEKVEDNEHIIISLEKNLTEEKIQKKIEIKEDKKPKDEVKHKLLKKSILDGTRSAKDYIEALDIDISSDLDEMEEIEDEWDSSLIFLENDEFNLEDLQDLGNTILNYAERISNTFYEFEAIGFALTTLSKNISDVKDVSEIESKNIKKLTILLELLKEDIIKWRKIIFVEQDTENVHYLDSSLLSSCMQIEAILKNTEVENQDDEDDFELF